jgi:hypothetical protein
MTPNQILGEVVTLEVFISYIGMDTTSQYHSVQYIGMLETIDALKHRVIKSYRIVSNDVVMLLKQLQEFFDLFMTNGTMHLACLTIEGAQAPHLLKVFKSRPVIDTVGF